MVFLESLGIKGIWSRESPDLVVEKWERVINTLRESIRCDLDAHDRLCRNESGEEKILVRNFTGTIIILAEDEDPISLVPFISSWVGSLFNYSLFEEGVMLRGAISIGEYYYPEKMVLGPAIDDAVEWQSRANWAGVILTPQASYGIHGHPLYPKLKESTDLVLPEYPVPMNIEGGERRMNLLTVGWPALHYGTTNLKRTPDEINDIIRKMSHIFSQHHIGMGEENKYRNTLDYVREIMN